MTAIAAATWTDGQGWVVTRDNTVVRCDELPRAEWLTILGRLEGEYPDALVDYDGHGLITVSESTCLACPVGCRQCSRDEGDCECYEHPHPDDQECQP